MDVWRRVNFRQILLKKIPNIVVIKKKVTYLWSGVSSETRGRTTRLLDSVGQPDHSLNELNNTATLPNLAPARYLLSFPSPPHLHQAPFPSLCGSLIFIFLLSLRLFILLHYSYQLLLLAIQFKLPCHNKLWPSPSIMFSSPPPLFCLFFLIESLRVCFILFLICTHTLFFLKILSFHETNLW